ncbi:PrsW family glutamic-type intramembrane protease [Microbacterium sp. ARD32]|uniref:PrsW family glutamic-type intramembrane protease n=1 Tax=Microbacterium sp. ARD32 TaxID=2962577 RepID=UPI0028811D73|nr:PrsW family glutamic-type intramembrane protease [Microbacterium sp. ARD32]MDT0156925.1 PrsW family glutamic-type intramembrane protease [Microbacterium sp. ARD32]
MSFGGQPAASSPPPTGQPAHGQPRQTYGLPPAPVYGQPPAPVYGQPPQPVHGQPPAPAHGQPAAPAHGQPAPVASGAGIPALPMPVKKGRTVSIWVFGVLGFAMLALIAYFAVFLGTGASVVGLLLAFVPLGIVLFGVHLIDRWEPEPRSLVIFALAWGGVAAVGIALLFDLLIRLAAGRPDAFFSAVVQAPIIEEAGKGLGVLLIFVIARRAFDGPVDGVVYGALAGAGFAFTENIQYFGQSLITGGAGELTITFVLRGLMSPFAHAMFTALTGFALGLAARRGAAVASALGTGTLGLLGAIALHAFWNGSSLLGDFFTLYLTAQIPLFAGFIIAIVALRRAEARLTQRRLDDYATAGWFTSEEVVMLATPAGRRAGLRWARGLRGDRRTLMRSFIKDATALAAVRQRAITGHDAYAASDEQALLLRTRATRAQLLAY